MDVLQRNKKLAKLVGQWPERWQKEFYGLPDPPIPKKAIIEGWDDGEEEEETEREEVLEDGFDYDQYGFSSEEQYWNYKLK